MDTNIQHPIDGKKTSSTAQKAVFIASTMRSGSTLLKALLANAPDTSNLPETDFQKLAKGDAAQKLSSISKSPIVVLKRPGWFNEIKTYPRLPTLPGGKVIALVRDVYGNARSLRQMFFRHLPIKPKKLGNRFFAKTYWCGINETLLRLSEENSQNVLLVRYEDILADPKAETKKMFEFIGSVQKEGVETYPRPENYSWKWGKDDGGKNIQSLRVQPPKPERFEDAALLETIKSSRRILTLREKLRYPPLSS